MRRFARREVARERGDAVSNSATASSVSGSVALTPTSTLLTTDAIAHAPANPIATPIRRQSHPLLQNFAYHLRRASHPAPSAIRFLAAAASPHMR